MRELTSDEKKMLIEAIDHYSLFSRKYKIILKALVTLAIRNVAIITIKELGELCDTSKPIIYKALELFNEKGMVEIKKREKSRLSEFVMKPNRLEEIIEFYNAHKKAKENLTSIIKKIDIYF